MIKSINSKRNLILMTYSYMINKTRTTSNSCDIDLQY